MTICAKLNCVGLAWITGNSATGKSQVCAVLADRGYRAIDSDLGIAAWVNRSTGEVTEASETGPLDRDWFRDHVWMLIRDRVEALIDGAGSEPVFLCGMAQNDEELWDLFDVTICLTLDEETIQQRIELRSRNPFGKAPAELEAIKAINRPLVAKYAALGATLIDSSKPLESVVSGVLEACATAGIKVTR